jgi:hypothetical protein
MWVEFHSSLSPGNAMNLRYELHAIAYMVGTKQVEDGTALVVALDTCHRIANVELPMLSEQCRELRNMSRC